MKITLKPYGYLLLCVLAITIVSLACNLPGEETAALKLEPRAADGSVSGSYYDPAVMGDKKMLFSVTDDGFATYHLEGAAETDWLTVGLNDDQTAIINWKGIVLDGNDALTPEEQAALDELMSGELAQGLEMLPIDIGCQGQDQISPKQVAALLVPLQLRFKYQVTARSTEALKLIDSSKCGYGSWEQNKAEKFSVILLSPSSPVPAVFGYFPLDEKGSVDAPASSLNEGHTACMPASSSVTDGGIHTVDLMGARNGKNDEFGIAPYGPCDARCRGACGSDCTPNNCTEKEELRCEVDEQGQHTGMEVKFKIYECGVHEACIDHDACYDDCNFEYGCDSWVASFCMHGLCDAETVAFHGVDNGILWANGLGKQPMRETYAYLDENFEKQQNLGACPTDEAAEPALGLDSYIPSGTYIGEFPWNETSINTLIVNEIIIEVLSDGLVSGSATRHNSYSIVHHEKCTTHHEFWDSYTINGQIDSVLNAPVEVNKSSYQISDWTNCSGSSGEYNKKEDECSCEGLLTISDGELTISCGAGSSCGVFLTAKK